MANPRIQVPLDDKTYAAIQLYSDATGLAMGKACADILSGTADTITQIAIAIQSAKTAPAKAVKVMNEELDRKMAEIDQHQLDLGPQVTKKKKKTG